MRGFFRGFVGMLAIIAVVKGCEATRQPHSSGQTWPPEAENAERLRDGMR